MADDVSKVRGVTSGFSPDKPGQKVVNYPVLGIVKNNVDSLKSGRLQVYISEFGASDPDDRNSWVTVSYMSPFYGQTNGPSPRSGVGKYINDPHSYGFWYTPPDLETHVVCIFLRGDINFGYYIGCIPQPAFNQMIPAIGSVPPSEATLNPVEAQKYVDVPRFPVTEINDNDPSIAGSIFYETEIKPVHSYHAAVLFHQGLIRDPDRGVIGSSAMRESPSRVFGISTPGRPVYMGGQKDAPRIGGSDPSLNVDARRGGHTFTMDDGDAGGADQLMRLRTTTGHMIMMNDTIQSIFIMHSSGKSWIEMGLEGTIDMYTANSFNVRSEGDVNLHADRDINFHAKKKMNIYAEQLNVTTKKDMNFRVGTTFNQYVISSFTVKVDGGMSMLSGGDASYASSATTYINGSPVNINSGSTCLVPQKVPAIPIKLHDETILKPTGFWPLPLKLPSITSRCPAHSPWTGANFGVDVKVNFEVR
jgi:hypothetical protein